MKHIYSTIVTIVIAAFLTTVAAQTSTTPDSVYIKETFGTGTVKASLPAGRTTYSYNGNTSLNDGDYMLYKRTNGRPEWHNSTDHTGDANGRCMVINASYTPSEFYRDTVSGITSGTNYNFYLSVMNVNTLGTCGSSALLPKLQFIIESYNSNGTFSQITSFSSAFIPQTANPTWVTVGGSLIVPSGVTNLRLRILNNSSGGCGNDLAIDDITFARSANIFTLPVTGFEANALRSGDNVNVQWQTLSESNTHHYIVEKSNDAANWISIDSVAAAGYSQSLRNYYSVDNKPYGISYYRIKQVDNNGRLTYSNTVKMVMNTNAIKATTFPNPFVNQVQVDLTSSTAQTAQLSIHDMSGRKLFQKSWTLVKGNNSITLPQVKDLPVGMYILNIVDADGGALYKTKLIKN
ncbi:MAG: T9SS type A sorting domain-containing protein [Bacteroidetes bacterium]|nr:T9SS type A sorting domain-containing protein [Bacteroidota bacterium]